MTRHRLRTMNGTVVLSLAVIVLALAGNTAPRTTARQPVGPVAITWPLEGRAVPGPNVLVAWTAARVSIGAAPADPAAPRALLIVDGVHRVVAGQPIPLRDGIVRAAESPAVVPNLTPGQHSVQLVVVDSDGLPVVGADQPTVTFTVLEPHPAQVYRGTCDDLDPDPSFALNDVGSGVPDPLVTGADAASTEPAEPLPIGSTSFHLVEVGETALDVPLAGLLAEPHVISVRGSAEAPERGIACGDIGGPAFRGTLRVGLAEQDDSGHTGVATLSEEGGRTRILIELMHDSPEQARAEETGTPRVTPGVTVTSVPGTTATITVVPEATATMTATTAVPAATETPVPAATATSPPPPPTRVPCPGRGPVPLPGCPTSTPDIRVPTGIVLIPTATPTRAIPEELLTPDLNL
jgi:hypothetical protein